MIKQKFWFALKCVCFWNNLILPAISLYLGALRKEKNETLAPPKYVRFYLRTTAVKLSVLGGE